MIDPKMVGKGIARLRTSRGMTQQRLAAILNVSHQAVSKWENGMAMPDIQTFYSMSKLFGVTMEQILNGEGEEEPRMSLKQRIIDIVGKTAIHMPESEKIPQQDKEGEIPEEAALSTENVEEAQKKDALEDVEKSIENTIDKAIEGVGPAINKAIEGVGPAINKAMSKFGSTIDKAMAGIAPAIEEAKNAASEAFETTSSSIAKEVRKAKEENARSIDRKRIVKLAPFMSKEALDQLIRKYCEKEIPDIDFVCLLAPFLPRETLEYLCESCSCRTDKNAIIKLAPYLNRETLQKMVEAEEKNIDWNMIQQLAPFLGREMVDRMALRLMFEEEREPGENEQEDDLEKEESEDAAEKERTQKAIEEGDINWLQENPQLLAKLVAEAGDESESLLNLLLEKGILPEMLPYLEEACCERAIYCMQSAGIYSVEELSRAMGLLGKEALSRTLDQMAEKNEWNVVVECCKQLEKEEIAKWTEKAVTAGKWDRVSELADLIK